MKKICIIFISIITSVALIHISLEAKKCKWYQAKCLAKAAVKEAKKADKDLGISKGIKKWAKDLRINQDKLDKLAAKIEKIPDDLRNKIVKQLDQSSKQFNDVDKQITPAISQVGNAMQQIESGKKQLLEAKLKEKRLVELELMHNNLMKALDKLKSALSKIALLQNHTTCGTGLLCDISKTFVRLKVFIEKQRNTILGHITSLSHDINIPVKIIKDVASILGTTAKILD